MILAYKGKQLFYEDKGSGPVTVLLHGFLENHKMWNDIIKDFLPSNRFILLDLPGHGQSEVLDGVNTMHVIAEAIHLLLGTLHIKSVFLAGHSMGGYVALAFAKAYPAMANGVLLLNSTPHGDTPERKKLRAHGVKVAAKNYEALVSMSVANLFSQESNSRFEDKIQTTKQEALKTPLAGYIAGQQGMMNREDLSVFWKNSKMKKGMLLGSQDTLLNAENLHAEFSDFNVEIKPVDGGHMSQIENVNDCIKMLRWLITED